ncbi:MAG: hypothetical protein M1824_003270 [Vezdaea acicularis]|nr:MAG: hypothetical protein M1824_003270 [Vezdaea acicularis]
MAIGPNHPPPAAPHAHPIQPIDISSWASGALSSLSLHSPSPAGFPSSALSIPLDASIHSTAAAATAGAAPAGPAKRRVSAAQKGELRRRDSLKRREALLKGKEGSRRRQRWENDRLLNNPYAQQPAKEDWEVHPTYPVHTVPYYLAPLWEAGLKARALERGELRNARRRNTTNSNNNNKSEAEHIPHALRAVFKKARSAKGLLTCLEEDVRSWLSSRWNAAQELSPAAESASGLGNGIGNEDLLMESEDEEIVFVGRRSRGTTPLQESFQKVDLSTDAPTQSQPRTQLEMLVLRAPLEDQGAKFARFLLHNIAAYYGLRAWSITVGDPATREAYIGLPETVKVERRMSLGEEGELPRPLWGLV